MSTKNKPHQKLISSFLVLLIFLPVVLFYVPKKVAADCVFANSPATPCFGLDTPGVAIAGKTSFFSSLTSVFTDATSITSATSASVDVKQWAKEVLREVLKGIARKTLQQMTQSTVSWINTGFHGSPLFVENPGSFFKDIAKTEIKNLVNTIGYDNNRFPFGKATALSIINRFKSTFEQNSQYTLSKVVNDPTLLKKYREDFNTGGWDAFLINTQYPQNNYIGYTMMVEQEEQARLEGTGSSEAEKVNKLLQQGQGFLSPQVCPKEVNPNYDPNINPYKRPTFKCGDVSSEELGKCDHANDSGEEATCVEEETIRICAERRQTWDKTNNCLKPDGSSGFMTTTPGSVVGGQVIKALGASTFDSTVLAGAMGNSLSAIFDALLNKLMSSGLNALSNKISGTGSNNANDDFSYNGQTLGSDSTTGTNGSFNWNGPDQVIVLSVFKKDVKNAIDNANKELALINGGSSTSGVNDFSARAGILQTFESIWTKTQDLDTCLPGPNLGWQARVDEDMYRISAELEIRANSGNTGDAAAAKTSLEALKTKTTTFKNWVANKINNELPGSKGYITSVSAIKTTNEQSDALIKRESILRELAIKLDSIQTELNQITLQPDAGSNNEATLVRLKQRFDTMLVDLPTSTTVADASNKLADAKDKLTSLSSLITKCTNERTAKGWANPGGVDSVSNREGIIAQTEKTIFCSSYPDGAPVSCDVVFKTNISDYRK